MTPHGAAWRTPGSRSSRRVLAATAAVGLTLAAACGGSDPPGSTATTEGPSPRTATVDIVDGMFDPRRVEVAVGGSVTWLNDDQTVHMVAWATPNVNASPLIGKAGTYTRSFEAPGEYRYYCSIHNEMKGVVVVR